MKVRLSDDAILAERARVLALPRVAQDDTAATDRLDVLLFSIGDERLAIPMKSVSGIVRAPVITPLPRAVAPVYGVTVSRGRALTVFALAPLAADVANERCLIVIGDGHRTTIGLIADRVDETQAVSRSTLSPAPAGRRNEIALGLTDDAVLVLDASALIKATRSES